MPAGLKQAGVQIGKKIDVQIVKRIPGRLLIELNKQVGFRLVTKTGEKGVVKIIRVVPAVGGVIGGMFDAASCGGWRSVTSRCCPRRESVV